MVARPRGGQLWRRPADDLIVRVTFRRKFYMGENALSFVAWTVEGLPQSGGVSHEQDFVDSFEFLGVKDAR